MATTKRGLGALFGSTVGVKTLMALTGLGLFGFLVTHMAGNLLIYFGQDVFNGYAKSIKSAGGGGLVWVARAGLLGMFVVHVAMAFKLQAMNRSARPVGYVRPDTIGSSAASRYMIFTGIVVLAFVGAHLAHYTLGVGTDYLTWKDAQGRHDAYRMVVTAFSNPLVAGSYIAAMAILALHLAHGFQSLFRTLGNSHEAARNMLGKASILIALGLAAGFSLAPIGVLAKVVKPADAAQQPVLGN